MKERPIIFSGDMVRAILAGRKTQTRRVVKLNPAGRVQLPGSSRNWHCDDPDVSLACPYGQTGDRLWVRETFCLENSSEYHSDVVKDLSFQDGRPIQKFNEDGYNGAYWIIPHYRATEPEPHIVPSDLPDCDDFDDRTRWRPSIYMPRWASRITLEIVNVRVERLQDISAADIIAEGVTVDAVMDMLSPLNKEKPLPCHWFSSEYTDSSLNWCLKCAKKHQAELRKTNPNAEFSDALKIDGGWETDHDSHSYCEGCGTRLEGYLTIEGKLAEADHFKDFDGKITSEVAYDLLACIDELPPKVFWQITWTVINGHGNWKANPWVRVIEFKRVEGR